MPEAPRVNSPENDELVMGLVERALSRPPEEREAYLRSACSDDSQLFGEAWRYVQWEERMKGFLLDPLCPPAENERTLQPGDLLQHRFRIEREVAQGGMGVVYEARDEKLDRRIAIKCAKSGFRKRLPPEVRNASQISHPNVCKIYEIHTASLNGDKFDFLTMEFLEGETLAMRIRRGPAGAKEAPIIARQLCDGLAEAHRNQVIHGDLKSNNVILSTAADGGSRAVITDFGLASRPAAAQFATQSGQAGGHPDYMAPELLKGGKASVGSDIYALGVILFELATGRLPFPPETSWEDRFVQRPAPVKHPWNSILQRCLHPNPAQRFSSVTAIAKALAPVDRRPWWWGVAAIAAMASLLVVPSAPSVEPVRLAVLPFEADAGAKPLSNGLLDDTSDRLSRLKGGARRLTAIPLRDAIQNRVYRPEQAYKVLGATHTLTGSLWGENGRIFIAARLTEARSGIQLKEWRGEYSAGELRNMPVALAGMVTGALRLPPLAVATTVNAAAYQDFATGVSWTRRDTGVDSALPLLERAVAADPDSPLTHARLAEAQIVKYRLTNDSAWRERAMASLRNAELRNPDLAVVRLVAAMIDQYAGSYERAQADLQRALEIEPGNGDVWRRLGKVYQDADRFREALAAYQKAIEVQPDYFRNYQDLCSLHSDQANYEEAIRQCKKMVELAPDLSDSHFALALPYLNCGHYTEGEYELRVAIRLQERSSKAHHALGVALVYQDRNMEAVPSFQRALELGPATDLLYNNLGTAFRRARLPREANEAYRKGLALAEAWLANNARDGAVRSHLALLCARLNERSRAMSEAAQARQLSPGSVNVAWWLILTYEALGERDRALALIEAAPNATIQRIKRFPDLANLHADPRFQQLLESHHIQ